MTDAVNEREKWEAERAFREREFALKEREIVLREREGASKDRLAWTNPLVLAVVAAALAATGNAVVAIVNGTQQRQLEAERSRGQLAIEENKAEAARILEVIKTVDPDKAAENLKFLLKAGLIQEPARREKLDAFLIQRQPGEGPSLPPSDGGPAIRRDANGNTTVDIEDPWYKENVVTIAIPQLQGIATYGGGNFSGDVRFHRAAAVSLQAAFAEIEASGLLGDILTFDGALVPRTIRGTKRLSAHALGIAIDMNVRWNPFGQPPTAEGSEGTLARVAPIFEKHGFKWLGRKPPYDGGHFEFADRTQIVTK